MSFLLDTDTISYLYRGEDNVVAAFSKNKPSEVFVSSVSVSELRLGALRKKSKKINLWLDVFFRNMEILPFDYSSAEMFGKIASSLLEKGTPIGQNDTMIAAQAIARNLVVVSNNQKHFSKIRSLKVQNWL